MIASSTSTNPAPPQNLPVSRLSFAERDPENRTIQLWKYNNTLVATVQDISGGLELVPASKIYTPLLQREQGSGLLERLEASGLRKWNFVFDPRSKILCVLPYLIAS